LGVVVELPLEIRPTLQRGTLLELRSSRWEAVARKLLSWIQLEVSPLSEVDDLDPGRPEGALAPNPVPGSRLVDACDRATTWRLATPVPRGYESADAQLGAAAAVYRNAGLTLRSLGERSGESRERRLQACRSLLELGQHHVDAFARSLEAARWTSVSDEAES
jgi:hypothetical protein